MSNERLTILLLGATGSIGGALAPVLKKRGHSVTCLVRSSQAEQSLQQAGFDTVRGDITTPQKWIHIASNFDVVIPVAATWSDDMDALDHTLTSLLLTALATADASKTLIYTSGCWVYGNTADSVASESTPHDPLPAFSGAPDTARLVLKDQRVRGMVILPAMVYERDGGVLEPMIADINTHQRIKIIGSAKTRWPLVHRDDLASLYALMIERAEAGAIYNGAAISGMEVGTIAAALSKRFGLLQNPETVSINKVVKEMGLWASGYGLDQQMSGEKAKRELGWQPEHTDVIADLI